MILMGNTYSLNKDLMPSESQIYFIQHIFRLLITFANNLYPDQAQYSVRLDLDPNCLTLKEFFEKSSFKKISRRQQISSLRLEFTGNTLQGLRVRAPVWQQDCSVDHSYCPINP